MLLRELLLKANEAVRSRLLSLATPENRDEIRRVLGTICGEVSQEITAPRDFNQARELVRSMQEKNQLNEKVLQEKKELLAYYFDLGKSYQQLGPADKECFQKGLDGLSL